MTHWCQVLEEENDCAHTKCLIAAELLPPISEFNNWFYWHGIQNWLRFKVNTPKGSVERQHCVQIYWQLKKQFKETGSTENLIMGVVYVGIFG